MKNRLTSLYLAFILLLLPISNSFAMDLQSIDTLHQDSTPIQIDVMSSNLSIKASADVCCDIENYQHCNTIDPYCSECASFISNTHHDLTVKPRSIYNIHYQVAIIEHSFSPSIKPPRT